MRIHKTKRSVKYLTKNAAKIMKKELENWGYKKVRIQRISSTRYRVVAEGLITDVIKK